VWRDSRLAEITLIRPATSVKLKHSSEPVNAAGMPRSGTVDVA
jgi:hypothetical protein